MQPGNGGTGIANTGTLTLGTNVATTISGGGTISLGGFTATIPATGTVGLLGTAQTWPAAQTFELPIIADATDATKAMAWLLSGATTGTTLTWASSQTANRTLTVPVLGANDTLMTTGTAQTVTGVKTLELPVIADSSDSTKAIGFLLSGATTATTLTVSSSQTASRTLTVPVLSANDTIATLASANSFTATQTITPPVGNSGLVVSNVAQTGAASEPAILATTTFNNGATSFIGYVLNVINTASASNSQCFAVELSGVNQFSVDIFGEAICKGNVISQSTTNSTALGTGSGNFSGGVSVSKNVLSGFAFANGVTSTATAAGTTSLGNQSTGTQIFTGTTTQTLQLPAANLFGAGMSVHIRVYNRSTGTVTAQRAGSDTINAGATTFACTTLTATDFDSDGTSLWLTK